MSEQNNNQDNWHLDKRVNISHISATILLAIAAFSYIDTIDDKASANAINIQVNKDRHIEDSKHFNEQRKEDTARVEKQLDSINKKLDRLLTK